MTFGIPLGFFGQRYGLCVIYDIASNYEAKVDYVLKDRTRNWKSARFDTLVTKKTLESTIPC